MCIINIAVRNPNKYCFCILRHAAASLCSMRRSVSRPVHFRHWCMPFFNSHLDYGNSTLVGLHILLCRPMCWAYLYSSPRFNHITQLLWWFHRLKAKERIDFNVTVLLCTIVNADLYHSSLITVISSITVWSSCTLYRSGWSSFASSSQCMTTWSSIADRFFLQVVGPYPWNTDPAPYLCFFFFKPQKVVSRSSHQFFKIIS